MNATRPTQLRFLPVSKPLASHFAPEFFRAIPETPGVYLMKDSRDQLLYVGKSVNLRQRVSSYRYLRPEKHSRKLIRLIHEVRQISWEICETDLAAQLRENHLLRTQRPKFNRANTYPKAYFFIALSESENGFELCLTRNPVPAHKVYGAFKVSTVHVFAALLRWLWILIQQPESVDAFASRMFANGLRQCAFAEKTLLPNLIAFLEGTSSALVELNAGSCAFLNSAFGQNLVRTDLEMLTRFFETAARRNLEFRSGFEIEANTISPEDLDDLIVLNRFKLQQIES